MLVKTGDFRIGFKVSTFAISTFAISTVRGGEVLCDRDSALLSFPTQFQVLTQNGKRDSGSNPFECALSYTLGRHTSEIRQPLSVLERISLVDSKDCFHLTLDFGTFAGLALVELVAAAAAADGADGKGDSLGAC